MSTDLDREKQGVTRLYNLAVGQARVDEVAGHADAHNLDNELAIARTLVERKHNAIAAQGEEELAIAAGPLLDMLRKVSDLAVQGDALARRRGDLLDKARVQSLAERLINAVNETILELIEDENLQGEIITAIANRFLEILKQETQPNVPTRSNGPAGTGGPTERKESQADSSLVQEEKSEG